MKRISHMLPNRVIDTGFVGMAGRTLQEQRLGKKREISPRGTPGSDRRSAGAVGGSQNYAEDRSFQGVGSSSAGIASCPFYLLLAFRLYLSFNLESFTMSSAKTGSFTPSRS